MRGHQEGQRESVRRVHRVHKRRRGGHGKVRREVQRLEEGQRLLPEGTDGQRAELVDAGQPGAVLRLPHPRVGQPLRDAVVHVLGEHEPGLAAEVALVEVVAADHSFVILDFLFGQTEGKTFSAI